MVLLRGLLDDPPPLVPKSTLRAIHEMYDRFLRMPPGRSGEIEDAALGFGRILWPYRKAFEALIREGLIVHEEPQFAEELSPSLQEGYAAFRAQGARSLADLHDAVGLTSYVAAGDHGQLCDALLASRRSVMRRVRDGIARDSHHYEDLVREFRILQNELEQHIAALRRLADRAGEHPEVRAEILESVRTFERGIAHLAREPEAREICAALEGYAQRHQELRERRSPATEVLFGGR